MEDQIKTQTNLYLTRDNLDHKRRCLLLDSDMY